MFIVFASVIDALSSTLCIIDADDKPFATKLPIEVQNRIMWIAKHAEHLDGLTKVHKELKTRRTCELTDWLQVPKTYDRFHDPKKRKCPCERCDPDPPCQWCLLYATQNVSIEFMVLETKLQRLRDEFTMHEHGRYREFKRANILQFRDTLRFTVLHLLLPMLVHMSPSNYQFDYRRIRSHDVSFASISMAHMLMIEGVMRETGRLFLNPGEVKEKTLARARAWYAQNKKEKQ